jgi:hypothetical protein
METLQEEEPERYQSQFSRWIKEDISPEDVEDLYETVGL